MEGIVTCYLGAPLYRIPNHQKPKTTNFTIWMLPKIVGFPPKSSILIGFSIIFTIHFGGCSPIVDLRFTSCPLWFSTPTGQEFESQVRDVIPDFDVPMVDDLREPLLDCPDGPRKNQGEKTSTSQMLHVWNNYLHLAYLIWSMQVNGSGPHEAFGQHSG